MEEILNKYKEEKAHAKSNLLKTIEYTQNITERVNDNISFFSTYISNINEIMKNRKNADVPTKLPELKNDAPGFPGTDLTLLNSFFQLLNSLSETQQLSYYQAQNDIICRITQLEKDFDKTIDELKKNVKNERIERSKALHAFNAKTNALQQTKAKAEELHKAYETNPNPKTQKALEDSCEEFRKMKIAYKQAYKDLYIKHKNYMTAVNQTILKIKVAEISRCSELKCIVFTHAQNFDAAGELMNEICNEIDNAKSTWRDEFIDFAQKNGIVRTSFPPKRYEPLQFSFQDSKLEFKEAPSAETSKESPLGFAVAKKDFNEESGSLKEGERVYIYDNLKTSFSYVQTKDRKGFFVPSDILEEVPGDYNIVTLPYLASSDGEISVSAGDIVLETTDGHCKYYERVDGVKGTLPPSVLLENIDEF